MASLVLTSALLDATLSVGVYLQATSSDADKLSGASTHNGLSLASGAPLALPNDGFGANPTWDLVDINAANGRFSAISILGIDPITVNGDRAFSLYNLDVPVSSDDPVQSLTVTPAENDPFFDADGQVFTVSPMTVPLLLDPGLTLYVSGAVTLGPAYANAVVLAGASFSLEGNAASNILVANDAGGTLYGFAGDDDLRGGTGDDVIHPGAGNDAIDGGDGNDTAVFAGLQSAYSVSYLSDATQIIELATGDTNTLTNIEVFEFDDGPLDALFGSFSDADPAADGVEEGAPTDTLVGITALISTADAGTLYSLVTDASGAAELTTGAFKIDAQTGVISVAEGSLIDFEQRQTEVIFVRATLSTGEFQVRRFDIPVIAVDEPAEGLISIIDLPREGGIARSSVTVSDPDGTIVEQTYQWQTADTSNGGDWVDLEGATESTVNVPEQQSYVGQSLRLLVTVTDEYGGVTELVSSLSREILNTNDSPLGTVTIEGLPAEDQLLTATNDLSDEDGIGELNYQWLADGLELSGAIGSTYTVGPLDVGRALSVAISYTDNYGATERVESAATQPIANVNDAPQGDVLISGLAAEDQTLSVTNSLSDEDGIGSLTYQWFADTEVIPGATGTSLTLAQAQVGSVISVVVSYTDGFGTAESVSSDPTDSVANVNDEPEGQVTIGGTPEEDQTLTALDTLSDEDGLGDLGYQWQANGVDIEGATTDRLSLSADLIGQTISVVITYVDGYGTSEQVASEATAAVANVNDTPTGSVSVIGVAAQGQVLTAENTLSDEDGLGALSYQWLADGQVIDGEVGATLQLDQALVGKRISVRVTYTDGYGFDESVTSEATAAGVANINDEPTGTISVVGTAIEDSQLSIQNQLADEDGLGEFQYQWFSDGNPIPNTNAAVFSPTQAEVGTSISVTVSYLDGFGENESVTSAATDPVTNINDEPSGEVAISGVAREDELLSVSDTLADEDGLGQLSYQWYADAIPISGATGTSLALGQAQVGAVITVSASYTDGFGEAEQVISLATEAVENINDIPLGGVSVSGLLREDETLTVSTDNLTDEDGLGEFTYQWLAGGTVILNATTASLTLTQDQVGNRIVARVRYVDGYGAAEQVDSSVTDTVENVNDLPTGTVSIEGTAFVGDTLTVTNNLEDEDGLGEVIYTWYADGDNVITEGVDSLLLTSDTFGSQISVAALYFDSYGSLEQVTSQSSAAVGDDTPPVLTLLGDSEIQIELGTQFSDPGATAIDDVAGDLTATITVEGAVDSQVADTYLLTYSATDQSNNSASVSRSVTVVLNDRDGDGVPDDEDAFPDDPSETIDSDLDGVGDNADAFPFDPNETADFDGDATGDNQDLDDDNDGYIDPTSPKPPLLNAGTQSICGTEADGLWCDVASSEIASITVNLNYDEWRIDELAVGTDVFCALIGDELTCGGWSGGLNVIDPWPSRDINSITGYADHVCGIRNGDSLCWGNTELPMIEGVKAIAAGAGFTCALMSNGSDVACFDRAGNPATSHYTDNPVAIHAGNDLVCVQGSFQDDEFINCWAPSGQDSPVRTYFSGIKTFAVGGQACTSHEAGTTCFGLDPQDQSRVNLVDFEFIADQLAVGDDFACAAVAGELECWGSAASDLTGSNERVESVSLPPIDQFPFDSSEWFDNDSDGIGDNADEDDDNDSVPDTLDAFPLDATETTDTDGDGIGNNADNDDDGDGQLDTDEQFCGSDPLDTQSSSPDNELDGIPDCIDEDDDNDGVPDTLDADPFDPNVSSEEITRGFPLWLLQVIETRNQSRP